MNVLFNFKTKLNVFGPSAADKRHKESIESKE